MLLLQESVCMLNATHISNKITNTIIVKGGIVVIIVLCSFVGVKNGKYKTFNISMQLLQLNQSFL